jgi:hypothetical protein
LAKDALLGREFEGLYLDFDFQCSEKDLYVFFCRVTFIHLKDVPSRMSHEAFASLSVIHKMMNPQSKVLLEFWGKSVSGKWKWGVAHQQNQDGSL